MNKFPQNLNDLLGAARSKHVPKGQIILYEGDTPSEIYFVKTGIVKLYNIDNHGNEKILHLFGPNAVMPLAFFSGDEAATRWYYTALVDCDLIVVDKAALEELMATDHSVTKYLLHWFSNEVHELLVRLDSLGKTNVRDKLFAALRFLAVCHGVPCRSGWTRITFPVNHQLLADMIGVTRESTAMVMKEFSDKKVVRNPRLTILEVRFSKITT